MRRRRREHRRKLGKRDKFKFFRSPARTLRTPFCGFTCGFRRCQTATNLLKNAGVSDVVAQDIIVRESEAVSRNYPNIDTESAVRAIGAMPDVLEAHSDNYKWSPLIVAVRGELIWGWVAYLSPLGIGLFGRLSKAAKTKGPNYSSLAWCLEITRSTLTPFSQTVDEKTIPRCFSFLGAEAAFFRTGPNKPAI